MLSETSGLLNLFLFIPFRTGGILPFLTPCNKRTSPFCKKLSLLQEGGQILEFLGHYAGKR